MFLRYWQTAKALSLGFCKLTEIDEWSAEYDPIATQIQPPTPKEMTVYMNAQGQPILRLGKSQSMKYPSLDRQFSSLSTNTSTSEPSNPVHSPPRTPLYKPVPGRSKLDDHFLWHREKGSKNYYYCKRTAFDPKQCFPKDETSAPSILRHINIKVNIWVNILIVRNVLILQFLLST